MPHLAEGQLSYLAFLFSVVVHEASHVFATLKFGDSMAFDGGQVTLVPLPYTTSEAFGSDGC